MAGTGDRAPAEDLVAEAFARAWASWPTVSRHPAPAAWVVRTALNVRVSWWRRRRREVALDGHDRVQIDGEGLDRTVLAAVRALPERQREVVLLRIWLDLDTATVAAELGISPSTVAVHLSLAAVAGMALIVPMASCDSGTAPTADGPVAAGSAPALKPAAFTVARQGDGSPPSGSRRTAAPASI